MTEIRLHLFALALFIIGLEGYLLKKGEVHGSERSTFVLTAFCLFALYSLLEYLFRLFTGKRASAVLSLLPAGIVFLFLRDSAVRDGLATTAVAAAAIVAAAVRAACSFMPYRDSVLQYGVFVLDAVAIYFRFAKSLLDGSFSTDRILFIVLTILTLSSLQKIVCERNRDTFPFHYFILIGAIMLSAPMGKDPIDWTPVVKTGQRVAESALGIVDRASYYLSSLFQSGDYTTGYSSLLVDGRRVNQTDKTQLNLKIFETPYHVFKEEKTGKNMLVKKTVYLTGGSAADREQLIRFLKFMRDHGVSHEYAALFSEVAKMDVEYAYLDTFDEIAPVNSIVLQSERGKIVEGTGIRRHRKGYRIEAEYLDIDYGSPYLIDLLREDGGMADMAPVSGEENPDAAALRDDLNRKNATQPMSGEAEPNASSSRDSRMFERGELRPFSYDDACRYMTELFGVSLEKIMTSEEYEDAYKEAIDATHFTTAADGDESGVPVKEKNENPMREYLATDGADTRMKGLARDITKNAENSYDACRLIEQYLRQYTYDTDAVGGYDPKSDMSTSGGMADIAQRFLFETQKGYCVQYTSAMVILLRLSGIPARAQTGFRYVFPLEEESVYPVSSNCAHVWPEAFIDGFGWVPFEPTAAFRPQADYTWRRKAKGTPESTEDYDAGDVPDLPDPSTSDSALPIDSEQINEAGAPAIMKVVWPILFCIAGILIVLILYMTVFGKIRYMRATPEKKLMMDVEMIKKAILRQSEEKFIDRGLLMDYVGRVPSEMRPDLKKVFDVYYRITYGAEANGHVSPDENELARRLREQCIELSRTNTRKRGKQKRFRTFLKQKEK